MNSDLYSKEKSVIELPIGCSTFNVHWLITRNGKILNEHYLFTGKL